MHVSIIICASCPFELKVFYDMCTGSLPRKGLALCAKLHIGVRTMKVFCGQVYDQSGDHRVIG